MPTARDDDLSRAVQTAIDELTKRCDTASQEPLHAAMLRLKTLKDQATKPLADLNGEAELLKIQQDLRKCKSVIREAHQTEQSLSSEIETTYKGQAAAASQAAKRKLTAIIGYTKAPDAPRGLSQLSPDH